MKKVISLIVVIVSIASIFTACGLNSSLSNAEIKETIKTYMGENGQLYWLTYDDITVIEIKDRRTTEYTDEVTFYIEYNTGDYATTVAHFSKYEQGWRIDSVDAANYMQKR